MAIQIIPSDNSLYLSVDKLAQRINNLFSHNSKSTFQFHNQGASKKQILTKRESQIYFRSSIQEKHEQLFLWKSFELTYSETQNLQCETQKRYFSYFVSTLNVVFVNITKEVREAAKLTTSAQSEIVELKIEKSQSNLEFSFFIMIKRIQKNKIMHQTTQIILFNSMKLTIKQKSCYIIFNINFNIQSKSFPTLTAKKEPLHVSLQLSCPLVKAHPKCDKTSNIYEDKSLERVSFLDSACFLSLSIIFGMPEMTLSRWGKSYDSRFIYLFPLPLASQPQLISKPQVKSIITRFKSFQFIKRQEIFRIQGKILISYNDKATYFLTRSSLTKKFYCRFRVGHLYTREFYQDHTELLLKKLSTIGICDPPTVNCQGEVGCLLFTQLPCYLTKSRCSRRLGTVSGKGAMILSSGGLTPNLIKINFMFKYFLL
ncbi:unnamed protein product [Paramecium octaurelia]|uniref:Uncharacterized protein n=1 Tax=Paramecium octaurelia TaxID=43137 RepID=A0A8S1YP97_PAROT|nr:unnamed protein product [Paramecium octaurelia]